MTMRSIFVEYFFGPEERGSFSKPELPRSILLI